jgi:two-component system cell cycle response regulator
MATDHCIPPVQPRILIVDDYVDALPAWEIFLSAEKFEVLTATNGPDALALATRDVPDLVVLDLVLPGLSGWEVASAIRARPETSHIPLVASTGYSDTAHLDRARQAGFDAILVKPCDPLVLVATIRELLASARGPRSST